MSKLLQEADFTVKQWEVALVEYDNGEKRAIIITSNSTREEILDYYAPGSIHVDGRVISSRILD
jgi:hypothetical protein